MISDRRLYTAADRVTIVEEGDPRAAYLLVGAGCELDDREAERLAALQPRPTRSPGLDPDPEPPAAGEVIEG